MDGKEIRMIFGQKIKFFRNRRKWSQADLAESANISINYVGDIERGKKWPQPEKLSKLANALGIEVYQLFYKDEQEISANTRDIMDKFINDVSFVLCKSLSLSVSQSVEYVRKQFKLGKYIEPYNISATKDKNYRFIAETNNDNYHKLPNKQNKTPNN